MIAADRKSGSHQERHGCFIHVYKPAVNPPRHGFWGTKGTPWRQRGTPVEPPWAKDKPARADPRTHDRRMADAMARAMGRPREVGHVEECRRRRERLALLRAAAGIIPEEVRTAGRYREIAQTFGVLLPNTHVLLPINTVGVMGDDLTCEGRHVIVVRFVESSDIMTADWVHADYEVLARISTRIMNEVRDVNRVAYDISSKPPAAMEWE